MSDSTALDTLFKAPLKDFTATRNALAKEAGAAGAAIKAIEKPSAGVWAVNQVYWRERRLYDKLVRAAERVRAAHGHRLKGKSVDLEPLELAHRAALKAAERAAEAMLAGAGDAATDATMKTVQETLQALPVEGAPGRLTHPPGPVGFGDLTGLLRSAAGTKGRADLVTFAPKKPSASPEKLAADARRQAEQEAAREKAEAAARRLRRQQLERAHRDVEATLEKTRLRVTSLTTALETATAEVTQLERKLQSLTIELSRLPQ